MQLKFTAALFCALIATSGTALADPFKLDAHESPLNLCSGVQKNVRMMHNMRDNGAQQTFDEVKKYINDNLTGKGPDEEKLLKIYQEVISRIEKGEFSPPQTEHAEGQLKARQVAGTLCLTAFPTTEEKGPRSPVASPVNLD